MAALQKSVQLFVACGVHSLFVYLANICTKFKE